MTSELELWAYLAHQKSIDRNATNTAFAKKIGIDKTTLSRIISYDQCPSIKLAMSIETHTKGAIKWWKLIERCKLKQHPTKKSKNSNNTSSDS